MRALAILLLLCSVASADGLWGAALTFRPGNDGGRDGGHLGGWGAYGFGDFYLGGELALETYTAGSSESSISYHAVAGTRAPLTRWLTLLADLGAGLSQQTTHHVGLFGRDRRKMPTDGWAPSAALRAHLVADVVDLGGTTIGLALAIDLRVALDGDSMGGGAGLGVVVSH
ncbi:MAG: hypothetical protein JWP01_4204 [Myxococcales bacterium]|nr:hypothetical protein [Myxococcales bacterium]